MVEEKLYSYDEAMQVMDEIGMSEFRRNDAKASKLRQFSQGGTSVEILTAGNRYFVFYMTDADYRAVSEAAKAECKDLELKVKTNSELKQKIKEIRSENLDVIVCMYRGNKIINPNSATSLQNHEVIVLTNSNFVFVLNVLKQNTVNIKKLTPKLQVVDNNINSPFVIPDGFAEGNKVLNPKRGIGVIQKLYDGKAEILFEKGEVVKFKIEDSVKNGFLKIL